MFNRGAKGQIQQIKFPQRRKLSLNLRSTFLSERVRRMPESYETSHAVPGDPAAPLPILFEDDWLIAVHKPAGMFRPPQPG